MKKIPIIENHMHNLPPLGFIDASPKLEELLKDGTVTLGGSYVKHKDGTKELIEVSVLPSCEDRDSETIDEFCKYIEEETEQNVKHIESMIEEDDKK